jgi:tetrapyrrole methylase family protein/MazG family protein
MTLSAKITIVGLGSGDSSQISLGVWQILNRGLPLYIRTSHHPCVKMIDDQQISYQTFDDVYMRHAQFEQVYQEIIDILMIQAKELNAELIYAVPGHPMVAEHTVIQLAKRCKAEGIALDIHGGESFLDRAFLAFGFDPIDGFQLLDATQLSRSSIQPQLHTLIGQIYDLSVASEVKLTLMEVYPEDTLVYIGHHLGVTDQEIIEQISLHEIDHHHHYGNLSVLWIPKCEGKEYFRKQFDRLHEVVRILRSPDGCPWDRAQTHTSLKKYLIEETYEVIDAIDENHPEHLCEELGDLLLQVMLHAQIQQEAGTFNVYDVVATLHDKLIRRHPHVFQDTPVHHINEVINNWQKIKLEEKQLKGEASDDSVLSGIPKSLPSMRKALELQLKAAKVGFDWTHASEVVDKIREELQELEYEMKTIADTPTLEQQAELGDLLFAVINLARFLNIDPEEALAMTNRKFISRFSFIEQRMKEQNITFDQVHFEFIQKLWDDSK